MSHSIARTEDNSQDICLNCGMTGDLSKPCPQADSHTRNEIEEIKKKLNNLRAKLQEVKAKPKKHWWNF